MLGCIFWHFTHQLIRLFGQISPVNINYFHQHTGAQLFGAGALRIFSSQGERAVNPRFSTDWERLGGFCWMNEWLLNEYETKVSDPFRSNGTQIITTCHIITPMCLSNNPATISSGYDWSQTASTFKSQVNCITVAYLWETEGKHTHRGAISYPNLLSADGHQLRHLSQSMGGSCCCINWHETYMRESKSRQGAALNDRLYQN